MKLFSMLTAVAVSALISTAVLADEGGFNLNKTFILADTTGHAGGKVIAVDVNAGSGDLNISNVSQVSSTASLTPVDGCKCSVDLSQSVATNQQTISTGAGGSVDFAKLQGSASLDSTSIVKSKVVIVSGK